MPGPFDHVFADLATPEPAPDYSHVMSDLAAPEALPVEPQYRPVLTGIGQAFQNASNEIGKAVIAGPALIEAGIRRFVGPAPSPTDPTPLGAYLSAGERIRQGQKAAASYEQRPGVAGTLQNAAEGAAGSIPAMVPGLGVGRAAAVAPMASAAQQAIQRVIPSAIAAGTTTTTQEVQQDPRLSHLPYAIGQGIIEGVMTRLGGATGVEAMLKTPGGKEAFKRAIIEFANESAKEIPEEALTSGLQAALAQVEAGTFNPGEIQIQMIEGGLAGSMMSGAVNAPQAIGSGVNTANDYLNQRVGASVDAMGDGIIPSIGSGGGDAAATVGRAGSYSVPELATRERNIQAAQQEQDAELANRQADIQNLDQQEYSDLDQAVIDAAKQRAADDLAAQDRALMTSMIVDQELGSKPAPVGVPTETGAADLIAAQGRAPDAPPSVSIEKQRADLLEQVRQEVDQRHKLRMNAALEQRRANQFGKQQFAIIKNQSEAQRATEYAEAADAVSQGKPLPAWSALSPVETQNVQDSQDGTGVAPGYVPMPRSGNTPVQAQAAPIAQQPAPKVNPVKSGWVHFPKESGTLGIPRSEMPQINSEDRGALSNFLRARGIEWNKDEVLPSSLRPTQSEYSEPKVEKARKFEGQNRAIMVSEDGHVVDGHHQWLASLRDNPDQPIPVVRLHAPIRELLDAVRQFPSATASSGSATAANKQSLTVSQDATRRARVVPAPNGQGFRVAIHGGYNDMGDPLPVRFLRRDGAPVSSQQATSFPTVDAAERSAKSRLGNGWDVGVSDQAKEQENNVPQSTVRPVASSEPGAVSPVEAGTPVARTTRKAASTEGGKAQARSGDTSVPAGSAPSVTVPSMTETEAAAPFRATPTSARDVLPSAMGDIGKVRGDLTKSGHQFIQFFRTLSSGQARMTVLSQQGIVRIDLMNGAHFYLRPVESIAVPPEEIARAKAAGEIPSDTPDVSISARGNVVTLDGTKLIQMAQGAGRETAWHEALHAARAMGFIPDAQWNALAKKYAHGKTGIDAEEAIARAIESPSAPLQGFTAKLRRMMARLGAWLRSKGLTIQLPGEEEAASVAKEDVQSGRVFTGEQQQKQDGSRFRLEAGGQPKPPTGTETGRPDLANPATTDEGRQFVRNVRGSMENAGEPTKRDWETVNKEADQRDKPATRDDIRKKVEAGDFLTDTEVVIARRMIDADAADALKATDPSLVRRTVALVAGFTRTGTATARSLAIRRDPLQTPEQRAKESLVTAIYDLPRKAQKIVDGIRKSQQDAAPNSEEVKKLQDRIDSIMRRHEKKVQEIIDHLRKLGLDPSQINGLNPSKTQAAIREAVAKKGDMWDAIHEFWINSVLSGPQTHAANIVGNVANSMFIYGAEKPLRAALNMMIPGKDKAGKAETFEELSHLYSGMGAGFARAGRAFMDAWRTERPRLQEEISGDSMLGANQGEGHAPSISGKKGRIIRVPTRFMLATDEFFKSIIAQMEVGAQAYRNGKARGLTGDSLAEYIQAETATLGSQAWQDAMTQAKEAAFQGENKMADTIIGIRNKIPLGNKILPFVLTPLNIFGRGLRMTPLGTINIAQRMVREGLMNPESKMARPYTRSEVIQHLVETLGGTAVLFALMASIGDDEEPWITGTESVNGQGERALVQRTAPPFSIKIGDKWWSYGRIEPAATSIATIVDMAKQINRGGANAATLKKAMAAITEQVQNKTFLRTIGDLMEITTNPEAQGADKLADVARSMATGFVPNFIRQGISAQDDAIKEKRAFAQPWTSAWWGEQGRIFINDAIGGTEFTPKVDLWGRQITKGTGLSGDASDTMVRLISPTQYRDDTATKWDIAMRAWNNATPGGELAPSQPRTWIEDKVTHRRWYYSPDEYQTMLEKRGKMITDVLDKRKDFPRDPYNPTKREMDFLRGVVSSANRQAQQPYRDRARKEGVAQAEGD